MGKHVEKSGSPSNGVQLMAESPLNEDIRTFEEHQEIRSQIALGGQSTKMTCDGSDRSITKPDGRVYSWNTTTSQAEFVNGGFYEIEFAVVVNPATNNTIAEFIVENVSNPLDFKVKTVELPRSGVSDSFDVSFVFFSMAQILNLRFGLLALLPWMKF